MITLDYFLETTDLPYFTQNIMDVFILLQWLYFVPIGIFDLAFKMYIEYKGITMSLKHG